MAGSSNSDKVNKFFSAGLGRGSRLAAWAVACAGAGLWMYMENKDNGTTFSKDDIETWNKEKKKGDASPVPKDR